MKFNLLTKKRMVTQNYEGAQAYIMSGEMELYSAVATTGLNDSFYEKKDERLARIRQLVAQNDPEFVARLAAYARQSLHLRSIPMVLAVELAKSNAGKPWLRKTVNAVVQRADEITELLAYYQKSNERKELKKLNKLSKQLQKGLADSFNKFDEYQMAKYNKMTEVKLRDALFLVHPKAKNAEQQEIFNRIVRDELKTPYTWETELSALGQMQFASEAEKAICFREKWEELIDSGKVGYMALLRNLRNIVEAKVSTGHIHKVCSVLSDPVAVANSKQLPFRFLSAYREIKKLDAKYVSMILDSLEKAVLLSVVNLKGFDGKDSVLIACDVSGSMQKAVSLKSKIMLFDIGLLLGMILQSKCKYVVSGMFGDTWKIINVARTSILSNVEEFYRREGEVGYATNGYKVIEDLIRRKVVMDKVMIFTDCQLWNNHGNSATFQQMWLTYKKMVPHAKLYLFDLAGYGHSPLRLESDDVCLIAGWSDKVFDVLQSIEEGEQAIEKIKQFQL